MTIFALLPCETQDFASLLLLAARIIPDFLLIHTTVSAMSVHWYIRKEMCYSQWMIREVFEIQSERFGMFVLKNGIYITSMMLLIQNWVFKGQFLYVFYRNRATFAAITSLSLWQWTIQNFIKPAICGFTHLHKVASASGLPVMRFGNGRTSRWGVPSCGYICSWLSGTVVGWRMRAAPNIARGVSDAKVWWIRKNA